VRHPRAQVDDDLAQVQEDWEQALADLMDRWGQVSEDQRADLVEQVRDAVAAGDLAALATLSVDTGDAEDELTAAMTDLAEVAAQQMADEAAAQGAETAAGVAETAALAAVAGAMVGLLGAGLAVSAGMEALRVATPGRTADEVAVDVETHLAALSDSHLAAHLGGALSAAQIRGRLATLEIAPVAAWEASEINDRNRCGPCSDEDGTEFKTLDDAWEVYGSGTYIFCEGRWRCRGTIVATWDD
jgi:hypothetical protein